MTQCYWVLRARAMKLYLHGTVQCHTDGIPVYTKLHWLPKAVTALRFASAKEAFAFIKSGALVFDSLRPPKVLRRADSTEALVASMDEKNRKLYYARQRYAERRAQGICTVAGCGALPAGNSVRCARHIQHARKLGNEKQRKAREVDWTSCV